MKTHALAVVLLLTVACDRNSGPGITGEYFTRFEAVSPSAFEVPGLAAPITLRDITPQGDWIVDDFDHVLALVDPDTMTVIDTLDLAPTHLLADGYLTEQGRHYSADGHTSEPYPLPEDLTITDIATDPVTNTIYVGGVAPLIQGQSDKVGRVYSSTDVGGTWTQEANVLEPVQGDAASVNFLGVSGWITLGVCPESGVYEGGSPVCETYSIHDGSTARGYRYNMPIPVAYDADGRVIAKGKPDGAGPNTPDLVLLDPEEHNQAAEDMDHFHLSILPVGGGQIINIDGESTLWIQGWNWDGHQIFRSVEPLGRSHDQRSSVLGGKGCDDLYNKERKQGVTGDEMDVTLTNGSDELLWIDGIQRDTLSFISVDTPHKLVLEPGASGTVRHNEDAWLMAYTPDGRCKSFGPSTKMDGRTIR